MTEYSGLIRVLFDSEGNDIRDEKVYFKHGQYRVRVECSDCGKDLGCFCYDTLDNLLTELRDGIGQCARCWLTNICDELDAAELIEERRPDLHYMDTWEEYNEGDDDGSLRKELVEKTSMLTDDDVYEITLQYCDDYFAGRACDT